jgi:hypothetical protein
MLACQPANASRALRFSASVSVANEPAWSQKRSGSLTAVVGSAVATFSSTFSGAFSGAFVPLSGLPSPGRPPRGPATSSPRLDLGLLDAGQDLVEIEPGFSLAAGSAFAVRDGSRGASRASLPPCAGNGPVRAHEVVRDARRETEPQHESDEHADQRAAGIAAARAAHGTQKNAVGRWSCPSISASHLLRRRDAKHREPVLQHLPRRDRQREPAARTAASSTRNRSAL